MINQKQIKETLLEKLEDYCEMVFVPSNTTKNVPEYPYCSFNIINTTPHKGTSSYYEDEENGNFYSQSVNQIWSFTVQSDDDDIAEEKANMIVDFFLEAKRLELEDNDIVVVNVGAVTPRDNMLTIEYEYRKGLDVTLGLTNIIKENTDKEIIERATINNSINLEKEN